MWSALERETSIRRAWEFEARPPRLSSTADREHPCTFVPLPTDVRQRAESLLAAYCAEHFSFRVRDQLTASYGFRGNSATIYCDRVLVWEPDRRRTKTPIAQMRYDVETGKWSLYWQRASGRWRFFEEFEPTPDFERCLEEVDANPYGIFWG